MRASGEALFVGAGQNVCGHVPTVAESPRSGMGHSALFIGNAQTPRAIASTRRHDGNTVRDRCICQTVVVCDQSVEVVAEVERRSEMNRVE